MPVYTNSFIDGLMTKGESEGTGIIATLCLSCELHFMLRRCFIDYAFDKIAEISEQTNDLKQSLKKDKSFWGAFAELVLFHLLDLSGINSIVHAPGINSKRPDFKFTIDETVLICDVLNLEIPGEVSVSDHTDISIVPTADMLSNPFLRLECKILEKAEKYRQLRRPIVIALLTKSIESFFPDRSNQISYCLYGERPPNESDKLNPFSNKKLCGRGLFDKHSCNLKPYISAVVNVHMESPSGMADQFEVSIFHNPYAQVPITTGFLEAFNHFSFSFEKREDITLKSEEHCLTYCGMFRKSAFQE